MKEELVRKAYEIAKERYSEIGVDTEKVIAQMQDFHLSLHCWQTDDVIGFENISGELSGGIATTGNYPGRARNIDEVRMDIVKAKSLIPGTHRLTVDRDEVTPEYFQSWIDWAKENNMKLDFNSTSFSHPKSGNLSLANPDEGIRKFWIEHTKRCREISEVMGKAQGDPCIMNLWVHDGSKDMTVCKLKYRELLKASLDEIFATKYDNMKDCIESKVFGIGLESYTVGSNDFYTAYAAQNNKMITLDTGHFHPTESVADKVSAMLLYVPELMLHVSRPIRWDSDHVTIMDDPTLDLFPAPSTVYTMVSTISTLQSTASVHTLSAAVPHRSACCAHCSSPSTLCASMRLKARASSVWLCSKRRRRCRGTLFTTSSASATTCP